MLLGLAHPQFSSSLAEQPWADTWVCASCISPVPCILFFLA